MREPLTIGEVDRAIKDCREALHRLESLSPNANFHMFLNTYERFIGKNQIIKELVRERCFAPRLVSNLILEDADKNVSKARKILLDRIAKENEVEI